MLGYITESIPPDMIINTLTTKETFLKDSIPSFTVINFLKEGFALHRLLFDNEGLPCDFKFLAVNKSFEKLTNIKKDFILNKSLKDIFNNCINSWINIFSDVALHGKIISFKIYSIKLKKHFDVLSYSPKKGDFVVLFSPFTSNNIKSYEDNCLENNNLKFLAYHDCLTSLPNRRHLIKYLNEELILAKNNNINFALLFIDIDNFKFINDSLGHQAGDFMLKEFSNRLNNNITKDDKIFRLGGDEFIVFIKISNGLDSLLNTIKQITKDFCVPFKFKNKEILLSLSIGITLYPKDGDTLSCLMKNADTAMYRAKKHCGIYFEFFNGDNLKDYFN